MTVFFPMRSRYLPVLIALLSFPWALCAAPENGAPPCAASLVLPAGLHLLETQECFSTDLADAASSDTDALRRQLDRFPDTPATTGYRYWSYLRSERFLPALLTLIDLVNRSGDPDTAAQFGDEIAFLVGAGVRRVDPQADLFGRAENGRAETSVLSDRFFFILDQVVSLYAEGKRGRAQRDAWLLYRSLTLFFSTADLSVDQSEDPFFSSLLQRYRQLWKSDLLLSYLGVFSFLTVGDTTFLPSFPLYRDRVAGMVNMPERRDKKKTGAAVEEIRRFTGRLFIDSLWGLPAVTIVDTDDIHRWYAAMEGTSRPGADAGCAVFDERHRMLAPYRNDLFDALTANRALTLLEGCDPAYKIPFVIAGERLFLSARDRWLSSSAVGYHLLGRGDPSYRESADLMSALLLASLDRYLEERRNGGASSTFGEMLRYAYGTGRLTEFRDTFFLYPRYRSQSTVFTPQKTKELTDFISDFFIDDRSDAD
ncbi:MAG TPA: hypothetical protein P5077_10255 [bacterium]|nr:hypothetical protein [bacterium]